MKSLICMVGLPRSGKSTWAKSYGSPMVNPDSVRLAVYGQRYLQKMEPMVWMATAWMVQSLFLAGHDKVIVDATNVTRKRRDVWVKLGMENGYQTFFKVIDVPLKVCLERAVAANDSEIIPVIRRMHAEAEPLGPDEPLFEYCLD